MCEKNGPQLVDASELLFRQVDPSWLAEDGVPSSQAFYPWRDVDDGCLSADRESRTTAPASHAAFTMPRPNGFGGHSIGVWGLTVGELTEIGPTCWEDVVEETADSPANSAHALIEFGGLTTRWKRVGQRLKVCAVLRGCLFAPTLKAD